MDKKVLIASIVGIVLLGIIVITLAFTPNKKNKSKEIEVAKSDEVKEKVKEEVKESESSMDKKPEVNESTTAPKEDNKTEKGSDAKLDDKKDDTSKEKPDTKKDDKEEPKKPSGTPVALHGKLSVNGTQLVDKDGKPFQIKGVSTHGLSWFPQYVDKAGFQTIRDEWGGNCIRLAMYSAENMGYCTGGDKNNLKKLVNDGVAYATDLGMYVIIDWHVLGDQNPNVHKDEAIKFFDEMSKKYASYDNVIYEICNEPNSGVSWSEVKKYAEEVIPVIKANDKDAIIIVGTPTWSQDVDQAAADPIKGYTNIMYTLHFYADTHRQSLRDKMNTALNSGLPIFVTEFGTCDASGNGSINYNEANTWISTLNDKNISYCVWSLCNKNETCALIKSDCNKTSGWTESDLSEQGKWYIGVLNGKALGTTPPSSGNDSNKDNNNSNNSNNNNNNNNNSPVASANSGNTSAEIKLDNSWDNGSGKGYQYTVKIKNTSSSAIKDWSVTVDFGTNVSIDNSWNGTISVNGNKVVIKSVDYNNEIPGNGNAEVGIIIIASGSVNPKISIN